MTDQEFTQYVSFEEFRDGLPAGRFRVIVEPKQARRYVSQRLMLLMLLMPMIGIGLALAFTGRVWVGAALVALGVVLSRVVRAQSSKILLHLASHDRAVYEHVTQHGIMEVRRAGGGPA
jgi:exosome complex RNA-binding protein Rrp4